MKKLLGAFLLLAVGVSLSIGGEKNLREASLEELDEITGGGVLDDKIKLWDEAPRKMNDMNIRLKSERTNNGVQYIFEIKADEVSMK